MNQRGNKSSGKKFTQELDDGASTIGNYNSTPRYRTVRVGNPDKAAFDRELMAKVYSFRLNQAVEEEEDDDDGEQSSRRSSIQSQYYQPIPKAQCRNLQTRQTSHNDEIPPTPTPPSMSSSSSYEGALPTIPTPPPMPPSPPMIISTKAPTSRIGSVTEASSTLQGQICRKTSRTAKVSPTPQRRASKTGSTAKVSPAPQRRASRTGSSKKASPTPERRASRTGSSKKASPTPERRTSRTGSSKKASPTPERKVSRKASIKSQKKAHEQVGEVEVVKGESVRGSVNKGMMTYHTRLRQNRQRMNIGEIEDNSWVPKPPPRMSKSHQNPLSCYKGSVANEGQDLESIEEDKGEKVEDEKPLGKKRGFSALLKRFERGNIQKSEPTKQSIKKASNGAKVKQKQESGEKLESTKKPLAQHTTEEELKSTKHMETTLLESPPSPTATLRIVPNLQEPRRSPNVIRTMSAFQSIDDGDYYPIDPNKKGLVLFFYQTAKRLGWEQDLKAVRDTFEHRLDCELREFRDCARWQMFQKLRELEDGCYNVATEPPFDTKPYNYLIVMVAAHGGFEDKLGNYFKVSDNAKISCREVEDVIINNPKMKSFMGVPKVIVWNACRGKRPIMIMKDREFGIRRLTTDSGVKSSLSEMDIARGRPLMCDYIILFSCERESASYRDTLGGSYLIQLLCEELQSNPRTDLETIIKRINRIIGQRVLCTEPNVGEVGLQLPYTCNLQFNFRLSN